CWFKKLMSTKPSARMTSTEERNTEPITRTWIEVRHLNSRRYHRLFAVAAGSRSAERHVGLSGPDAGATSSSGEGPAPPDPVATAPSAGCVPSSADTAVEALSPGCATRSTPAASAEPTPSARTGEPAERRDSVSVSASGSAGPFGGTGLGISYSPDL